MKKILLCLLILGLINVCQAVPRRIIIKNNTRDTIKLRVVFDKVVFSSPEFYLYKDFKLPGLSFIKKSPSFIFSIKGTIPIKYVKDITNGEFGPVVISEDDLKKLSDYDSIGYNYSIDPGRNKAEFFPDVKMKLDKSTDLEFELYKIIELLKLNNIRKSTISKIYKFLNEKSANHLKRKMMKLYKQLKSSDRISYLRLSDIMGYSKSDDTLFNMNPYS